MMWTRSAMLWLHLAGVVVWFGAVAYFLLVLRPAVRAAEMERGQWYLLLRQIKRRLQRVVGVAVLTIVGSGVVLADARGLLRADLWSAGLTGRVFLVKLVVVTVLVVIYLTALPAIARIAEPLSRGKAFVHVHRIALLLGSIAAFLGLMLHG